MKFRTWNGKTGREEAETCNLLILFHSIKKAYV